MDARSQLAGRCTSLTRGNGTVTSYAYDGASRLSQMVQDLAGSAHDITLTFGYSPASQLVANTRSNTAYSWTDSVVLSRSYATNGLNQYTQSGHIAPTYDGRGNLTSAGAGTYGYTADNLLATAPGSNYAYDPMGRLFHESGPWSILLYDGSALIMETGSDGPIRRRYVHGPGTDEPLVWYEGAGTGDRRWLHADERGSVTAITNGSGAAIAVNRYDEYGIPAAGNLGRFQYTGQTWLPELGMYHYKARIYSPTLGRFLQVDPVGYEDQVNLYAYVRNDPVNMLDPTGTSTLCNGPCNFNRDSLTGRNAPQVSTGSQRGAASISAAGATVAGAAATGATRLPPRVTVDNRGTVRTGGPQGQPFRGNQTLRAAPVASVAGTAARVATPVAVGLDATAQVQGGKPVDQALVNAGSRGGFAVAVGTVAVATAPQSLGGSVLVAGAVLGADALLGSTVGNTAENIYNSAKHSNSVDPQQNSIERDDFCRVC